MWTMRTDDAGYQHDRNRELDKNCASLDDAVHKRVNEDGDSGLVTNFHRILLEQCSGVLCAWPRSDLSSSRENTTAGHVHRDSHPKHDQSTERTDDDVPGTHAEHAADDAGIRATLADIVARLCLWADVVKDGKAEATVTHSPSLYRNVVGLLVECGKDLKRMRRAIDGSGGQVYPSQSPGIELDFWLEKASYIFDDAKELSKGFDVQYDSDEASSAASMWSGSGAEEAIESLDENVGLLMDLLPSIEHVPALGVQSMPRPDAISELEVSAPAHAWVSQVLDKYPRAPTNLARRLGEANWQRFCRLRLGRVEAAAQDLQQAKSIFHDSGIGTSTGQATARAATVASHSSFASTIANDGIYSNRVPPEPDEVALGLPFTCDICGSKVLKVRNRIEWKLHVFEDIQPYICLFSDCDQSLTTFPSRSVWSEHDYNAHRRKTTHRCFDCMTDIETAALFEEHTLQHHADLTTPQRKAMTIAAMQRKTDDLQSWTCPLCQYMGFASRREFTTHIGRHLEEVALSTLPHELYNNYLSDESDDSQENANLHNLKRPSSVSFEDIVNEEDHMIKCTCGSSDDDGNTVLCEKCDTWQHIECYYRGKEVPDLHFCTDCAPTSSMPQSKGASFSGTDSARLTTEAAGIGSQLTNQKHKCPYCPDAFAREHNLRSHLLSHSDEKPYVCSTCSSRFRRLHELKRHTNLHTTEQLDLRSEHSQEAEREDVITRHHPESSPGGQHSSVTADAQPQTLPATKALTQPRDREKKYGCPHCEPGDKVFKTTNDLDRHIRTIHHIIRPGERVWKCSIPNCHVPDKIWTRMDNFKQHVIRMHGADYADDVENMWVEYDPAVHGAIESGRNARLAGHETR